MIGREILYQGLPRIILHSSLPGHILLNEYLHPIRRKGVRIALTSPIRADCVS